MTKVLQSTKFNMFSKNSNFVREILFSRGKNESHQKILAPRYIKMTDIRNQ